MFLLTYELVSDKKLWVVASDPSLEELKKHVEKYAMGTTFFVFEVSEDFDMSKRLEPPLGDSEPVFTWCDGTGDKAFLEEPVVLESEGKAKVEFTIGCEKLPEGVHSVVGLFNSSDAFVGRTEVVANSSSPVFQKNFVVTGDFKIEMDIKFSVYNSANGIKPESFLGCAKIPFKKLLNGDRFELHDNAGATNGAQLVVHKKAKAKKEGGDKKKGSKKKKGSNKKNKNKKDAKPSDAEKKIKQALKEGGKKGQDITGLSEMGGVSFFHVSVDTPEGDWDLMDTSLQGFNTEVDETAEDRKGGAGNLGKVLFSYNSEKLIFLCHVPDAQKDRVKMQDWFDVISNACGGKLVSTEGNVMKGEALADPDSGRFPIKLRDAAIDKGYNWLREQKLVLDEDSDDDEMVFGDDDFPDYDDEAEAEAEPAATGPLFATIDEGKDGADEYVTFDDDECLGKAAPSLDSLQYLNADTHSKPADGQVTVLVLWGQYHKPGYRFLPYYTDLQKKYGDKVKIVGVSIDPSTDYPTKFIEDPNKKYSTVFPCDFSMAWDNGSLKKELMEISDLLTMSPPHTFVLANNTIVWHQDHSELGATAPSYMAIMEEQIDHIVSGSPLKSTGNRPVPEYEEGDESDGEVCDVDMDDLF